MNAGELNRGDTSGKHGHQCSTECEESQKMAGLSPSEKDGWIRSRTPGQYSDRREGLPNGESAEGFFEAVQRDLTF